MSPIYDGLAKEVSRHHISGCAAFLLLHYLQSFIKNHFQVAASALHIEVAKSKFCSDLQLHESRVAVSHCGTWNFIDNFI